MTARLVLACLALSIAGGAATAQTPPGRPATTSQGPGTAVPLTDLLGGPAIPFSKPTDATEGRDMTLAAPADSARRTLPSAIAFPPRMPPRDRPGRRTVGPDGRTLDDVVAPADGEPVDAAIDRFTRALAPTTDAVRFALEDAIHDAVFWRAGDQAQKETR